jgi:hypothetical protein
MMLPAISADRDMTVPTDRSIPSWPPITTSVWPAATTARIAATVSWLTSWPPEAKPGATDWPTASSAIAPATAATAGLRIQSPAVR